MGYYTSFSMNVLKPRLSKQEMLVLERALENMDVFETIDGGSAWAYTKWYDADEDMAALSIRFPKYVFALEGYGEDAEDHWLHYYKGGKMQDANMRTVYDDFSESSLVPLKT